MQNVHGYGRHAPHHTLKFRSLPEASQQQQCACFRMKAQWR